MNVAILSANLNSFDNSQDPVPQKTKHKVTFHRYTDADFPPIAGLTPRFQYRIPKLFGWEMFPGHDVYIWMDGGITFERSDCVEWFLEQLGDSDVLFFRHPHGRKNIKEEVLHIERKLQDRHAYMVPRYDNGFHKESYAKITEDPNFKDDKLYASTIFVYRNTELVQRMMKDWWWWQSRYWTCDQVPLPYVIWKNNLRVSLINENFFKLGHVSLVSHHTKLA